MLKCQQLFVGILIFMSMINFVLSCVEHEKSFITSVSSAFFVNAGNDSTRRIVPMPPLCVESCSSGNKMTFIDLSAHPVMFYHTASIKPCFDWKVRKNTLFCMFCCFTAMVIMAGRSVHLTTLFPVQA